MEKVSREQFLNRKEDYCRRILEGAVFVYPTDTIYGIGCDASNHGSVEKIRILKQRDAKPFSVAAPSKEWIRENFLVNSRAEEWLGRLPGPYTLVLELKRRNAVAPQVNPEGGSVGVRLLDNWFSEVISELQVPVVSTSANITRHAHMRSLSDLDRGIAERADFVVYEGVKDSRPSSIVDLTKETPEVKHR